MGGFSLETSGIALEDGSSLSMEGQAPNILLENGEPLFSLEAA